MKVKCEYCGSFIDDTEENCPNCGAVNSHLKRKAEGTPKTIEELKKWYQDHNLPIQDITRFFIGVDYKGPKAFGIYEDKATGNFIVYKNKSNGTRSIRYLGKDEEYAVNELYMKLKEEILNQKAHNLRRNNVNYSNSYSYRRFSRRNSTGCLIAFVIFFIIIIACFASFKNTPRRGYYYYGNNYYYYQSGDWYGYDSYDGWNKTTAPDDLKKNYSDYYESNSYSSGYGVDDFSDTSYYDSGSSSSSSSSSWDSDWDSDWDSGSSWFSGSSWDSGSTDWSSDW